MTQMLPQHWLVAGGRALLLMTRLYSRLLPPKLSRSPTSNRRFSRLRDDADASSALAYRWRPSLTVDDPPIFQAPPTEVKQEPHVQLIRFEVVDSLGQMDIFHPNQRLQLHHHLLFHQEIHPARADFLTIIEDRHLQ